MPKLSKMDLKYSRVSSAQFFLYFKIACLLLFVGSCSYTLAKYTSKGGHKVEPPTYQAK